MQEGCCNAPQVSCLIYASDTKTIFYVVNSFCISDWMCVYKMESCIHYSNLLRIL